MRKNTTMSQQHPQYQQVPAPQYGPYAQQWAPAPPPKKKRTGLKIVLGGLAAFSVLVVGSCAVFTATGVSDTASVPAVQVTEKPVSEPDPTTEAPSDPAPTQEAEPEVVEVSAAKLIKAFEDNELKADAKYKGKTLQVSGVVSKVDTELFDEDKYILVVGTGDEWELLSVSAYDIPAEQLADLDTDDNVTVVGEFSDGGDLGVTLRKAYVK